MRRFSLFSITKDEQTAATAAAAVVINGLEAHFVVEIALKINLLGGSAGCEGGGQSYRQTLSMNTV